jgi:hypothetical protein
MVAGGVREGRAPRLPVRVMVRRAAGVHLVAKAEWESAWFAVAGHTLLDRSPTAAAASAPHQVIDPVQVIDDVCVDAGLPALAPTIRLPEGDDACECWVGTENRFRIFAEVPLKTSKLKKKFQ